MEYGHGMALRGMAWHCVAWQGKSTQALLKGTIRRTHREKRRGRERDRENDTIPGTYEAESTMPTHQTTTPSRANHPSPWRA